MSVKKKLKHLFSLNNKAFIGDDHMKVMYVNEFSVLKGLQINFFFVRIRTDS